MKAGTTALNVYLKMHSQIIRTKSREVHFYDFAFSTDLYDATTGIHRRDAREAYRRMWQRQLSLTRLHRNASLVAFDDSPRYLFDSSITAPRVLCVTPWVKLLALLRNPIDRAYSHYHMKLKWAALESTSPNTAFTGFEEWIHRDLQDLIATGVVQSKVPASEFVGSIEQDEAWKRYTRLGNHAPIGRGLYAIQIRQWYKAMDDAGRARTDLKLTASETMHDDPEESFKTCWPFSSWNMRRLQCPRVFTLVLMRQWPKLPVQC